MAIKEFIRSEIQNLGEISRLIFEKINYSQRVMQKIGDYCTVTSANSPFLAVQIYFTGPNLISRLQSHYQAILCIYLFKSILLIYFSQKDTQKQCFNYFTLTIKEMKLVTLTWTVYIYTMVKEGNNFVNNTDLFHDFIEFSGVFSFLCEVFQFENVAPI